MILVGAIGGIILNSGLFFPYPEMWKRGGRVVGISELCLTFILCFLPGFRFHLSRHGLAGGGFLFIRLKYDSIALFACVVLTIHSCSGTF